MRLNRGGPLHQGQLLRADMAGTTPCGLLDEFEGYLVRGALVGSLPRQELQCWGFSPIKGGVVPGKTFRR
jgi:hypothetical protein